MKQLFSISWCGFLMAIAPASLAASGDIAVRITDMSDQAIAGTNGAKASIVGVDDRGPVSIGPKYADAQGVVQFAARELSAATQGRLRFVIYTSGNNSNLQGKLYDPFGFQWTYIEYRPDATYDFTIPTPTTGSAQPDITWNKANVQLRFNMDWGQRRNRDFWFTRVVLQKKAVKLAQAGSDYGLTPVISDSWIKGNNLAADDGGLAFGQTGNVRLTGQGYDQTFLAKKSLAGSSVQYQVFLVNCLWGRDLVGIYDPAAKTYTVEFDSASVFADSTAPAWEGNAMKSDVDYFALLQGETWLVHSAGANGGLACAFGPPVAESLLHPFRVPVTDLRLRAATVSGGNCTLEVIGAPGSFIVEYSADLKKWQSLGSGTLTASTGVYVDRGVPNGPRFYRLRRSDEELQLRVVSWRGGVCNLVVSGSPGPVTIEYTVGLLRPRWITLVTVTPATMPYSFSDSDALEDSRFYRVRR